MEWKGKRKREETRRKKKGGGRGLTTSPNHVPLHPKHFLSYPSNKMCRDGLERWMEQDRKVLSEEYPLLHLSRAVSNFGSVDTARLSVMLERLKGETKG